MKFGASNDGGRTATVKDHSSSSHPDIPNKKNKTNWVEQAGGLPKYIERIAKHLVADEGFTVSRAIATAVNTVKRWAAGGGGVSAATQAKAAKALAEWERKKAKSHKTDLSMVMEMSRTYQGN